ncbi:MAG: hypothetical protein IJH82_05320 [Lachnospiraceae bacterium]|nr:hypothetical protein [Lachnospiraceae bacterium]
MNKITAIISTITITILATGAIALMTQVSALGWPAGLNAGMKGPEKYVLFRANQQACNCIIVPIDHSLDSLSVGSQVYVF